MINFKKRAPGHPSLALDLDQFITRILLYSSKKSNRLRYICSVLLEKGLFVPFEITDNEQDFTEQEGIKINYSDKKINGSIHIRPHALLFEFGIKDHATDVTNHPVFEKIIFAQNHSDLAFDIFAAAFWLLSRYEEYLPHKTDHFNRFHYKSGLAWQNNFLQLPLVNIWIREFGKILVEKFPESRFASRKYNFISSIDIDNVWKFKHKGFVRTAAGYFSDLVKRDLPGIKNRTAIIFGRKKDPFDCYDFLIEANGEKHVQSLYFLLLGDYGVNDKNHASTNLHFQALIKHLSDYSDVGIHPSFGSTNNLHQLKVETGRLAAITHREVFKSRQHFSILKFPQTYQYLLQAGIREDYSMGYTNINGFRASFCFPYPWYDLDEENMTSLVIHPFCISENTAVYFSEKEKKDFQEMVRPLIDQVKNCGGELISIFHNNNFTDDMKKNYRRFLEMAVSQ